MQTVHTYFSLRYGMIAPDQLVAAATAKGIDTLVLTDINNTSAVFPFIQACKTAGIKPLLGIEFRRDHHLLYIGIAKNWEGFYQLNQFLSAHSFAETPLPDVAPDLPDTYIIYEFQKNPKPLADFRTNELIGVRHHQLTDLYFSKAEKYPEKLVALSPVTFLNKTHFKVHQILRTIDLNILISQLKITDIANQEEVLYSKNELLERYKLYPKVVFNTQRILATCEAIDLPDAVTNNRQTFTGSKDGDLVLLKKLAFNGYKKRYGENSVALKRIESELKVIWNQGFCAYFLITWDIVRYAQNQGSHHVGRGSGANSIVAFCIGITDVDPIELGLYFERFINPYRHSPPDFDIDFCHDELDDVRDYILKRYGSDHTAFVATYSTFNYRSIVRELGKVFGLPKADIDLISKHPEQRENHHPLAQKIFKWGKHLQGMPNQISMHASGIIIAEKPLHYFSNMKMMPKGFPIVAFDMHIGEDMGFHKYDILGQRGIGHIRDALQLISQNHDKDLNIHRIQKIKNDPAVKAQLQRGECIGCFYIESPAMRQLLKKLRCDNYVHLVAASSIIRPGVAKSGMMKEYIRRSHQPKSFKYLHPIFEEQLGETYGVMVYQEDVLKILHHFAGLDLGESDVVRRIMSGKKAKGDTLEKLQTKYYKNCQERGHSVALAQEVWRQIESFSGYSFCKAHSASYAVESFQSLYLKTYFPIEFAVAVVNNFGGFYQNVQEVYFYEALKAGATLHAPCVNESQHLSTVKGKEVYVGFVHIESLETNTVKLILQERKQRGAFKNLADFVTRVNIGAKQLELLIRINAFRFTNKNKYELMWEKNRVFNPKVKFENTGSLFPDPVENFQLPILKEGDHDQAFDERELIGFQLTNPFRLLKNPNQYYDSILAKDLNQHIGRAVKILGYYICKKYVRTKKGEVMYFGCWLDETGRFFDTTHFPFSLQKYPFRGRGIYQVSGTVDVEFGFASLTVLGMELLEVVGDGRYRT